MSHIFPSNGVPASQTAQADPTVDATCDPIFYPVGRCNPRFDPAAANAVISEIANVINGAGLELNCDVLDNLFLAIKELIQLAIVDCLKYDFNDASGACSIQSLVLIDDGTCQKIASYSDATATLATATQAAVYPVPFGPLNRPTNTADPASFYNAAELAADVQAGTINESKLTQTKMLQVSFDVPCDNTQVEILIVNQSIFDPTANGGAGTIGGMALRVDGVFGIANNFLQNFKSATNYESTFEYTARFVFSAGVHIVEAYALAAQAGTPPSQFLVRTFVGGAAAGTITARVVKQ
jgi:hypothetical protein